jgi:hypothetical protein
VYYDSDTGEEKERRLAEHQVYYLPKRVMPTYNDFLFFIIGIYIIYFPSLLIIQLSILNLENYIELLFFMISIYIVYFPSLLIIQLSILNSGKFYKIFMFVQCLLAILLDLFMFFVIILDFFGLNWIFDFFILITSDFDLGYKIDDQIITHGVPGLFLGMTLLFAIIGIVLMLPYFRKVLNFINLRQ